MGPTAAVVAWIAGVTEAMPHLWLSALAFRTTRPPWFTSLTGVIGVLCMKDPRPLISDPFSGSFKSAADAVGVQLAGDLSIDSGKLVVLLSAPPSLLRRRDIVALAATTTLSRTEVERIVDRATSDGLITPGGRLTEAGQQMLKANRRGERHKPTIATNTDPYYPQSLRIPRGQV